MNSPAMRTFESLSPEVAFSQSDLGKALMKLLNEGSASNQAIAEYLLRNAVRVTAFGIEELSAQCAVSTATVSRFARELGFPSYQAMRSEIAGTMQKLLQPVEKLRSNIANREGKVGAATESLEYAVANITATNVGLSDARLADVVRKLVKAKTVYVMGFGLSSHLAGLLALHLQPFCPHVVEVAGHGGTEVAAGHLATITPDDVLVVISFPRYALDVIRLAGFAKSRSASIIALTDSPASPLTQLADIPLFAQSMHPVLPSSASAALALIEALVAALMISNKDNVEKAARLTEAISAYLYGEDVSKVKPKKSR